MNKLPFNHHYYFSENARSIDRMVKRETKSTNLDRPWEEMVQAVIQKYPNPHSKSKFFKSGGLYVKVESKKGQQTFVLNSSLNL